MLDLPHHLYIEAQIISIRPPNQGSGLAIPISG